MRYFPKKRTPGHLGGSKPQLKKRRVHDDQKDGSVKSRKKLQPVEDPNDDDPVVEVVAKDDDEEQESVPNPLQELISCLASSSKSSISKAANDISSKEKKSKSSGKSETQEEVPKIDETELEIDSGEDDDAFDSTLPTRANNSFESHISRDIQEYVQNYGSLHSVSREMRLPALKDCLYEYKVTDSDLDNPLHLYKSLGDFDIKQNLIDNLQRLLISNRDTEDITSLDTLQYEILSILAGYKDLLYCERTHEIGERIRPIYCLHALNHVLKTRSKIIHHNTKLSKSSNSNTDYRDQGLTRPKVLILLPFRESARRTIDCIIELISGDQDDKAVDKINIMNIKRYHGEFQSDAPSLARANKPQDYNELFAGDTDDSFRMGISVTKKSLKLYSDFYTSDIIVASPLGLRIVIGAEGDKERDFDFLSSIELIIMDQTEVFLMQNWEHVLDIMKLLNIQPNESHGVDFSRVRMWALDGLSKYYRQSILISSVQSPQITSLFKTKCFNYEGRVLVRNSVLPSSNQLRRVVVQSPQTFYRFESNSLLESVEERFKTFTERILPRCRDLGEAHTMIFIPSYFDFVKLRNYFRTEDINFTQICEYSKPGKISQSRAWFFHEGRNFLLYTERCHFYNRFRIKGIRHLVFYQLPIHPHFYSELCNLLHPGYQGKKFQGDEASMNCTVMYDKFDFVQLQAVVGAERASYMINSGNDEHIFLSQAQK